MAMQCCRASGSILIDTNLIARARLAHTAMNANPRGRDSWECVVFEKDWGQFLANSGVISALGNDMIFIQTRSAIMVKVKFIWRPAPQYPWLSDDAPEQEGIAWVEVR